MSYEVTCFDELRGAECSLDFRKNPILIARASHETCARQLLEEIYRQLPWESVSSLELLAFRNTMAMHDYHDECSGDGSQEEYEVFYAPWRERPLCGKTPADIAPGIADGMETAVAAFKADKTHPYLAIVLPWLDSIWTPGLAAALGRLLPKAKRLARQRVFFLLGASPAFRPPEIAGLPEIGAEPLSLSSAVLYSENEIRAIRYLAQMAYPRRAPLHTLLKLGYPEINALWRELTAKGLLFEKDGEVQMDGDGILKSIEGIRPEIGSFEDLVETVFLYDSLAR